MLATSDQPTRVYAAAENGSAYLATLLLLVLLTLVGLSLAVVTQSEVFIGGSERVTTRTYYNALSGIHLMNTYKLVANDPAAHAWTLRRRAVGLSFEAVDRVITSPYFPIAQRPCAFCMMNDDNALRYIELQSAATARAQPFVEGEIAATKVVGAAISLSPVLPDIVGQQFAGDQYSVSPDSFLRVPIQF